MTDKNRKQAFIRYFGREKFEDTKPERNFDAFCLRMLPYPARKPKGLWVMDEGKKYQLVPDRLIGYGSRMVYIEIDGPHHRTARQESKSRWRDDLVSGAGFRILHIDAELTEEKWWRYLNERILEFLRSHDLVGHIFA